MGLGIQLDLVDQQVTRGQHVIAAAHAVAEVHTIEQEGQATLFNDALTDGLSQRLLMNMSGIDFIPGIHNTYTRLLNILIIVAHAIEKGASALPVQSHAIFQITVDHSFLVAHGFLLHENNQLIVLCHRKLLQIYCAATLPISAFKFLPSEMIK